MPSKLGIFCKALMEACWLAAAITVPLFFNISSAQTFEPDKVLVLKFLTVLCGAACLLKWFDGRQSTPAHSREPAWKRFQPGSPLVISVLALAAIYTLSSIFSLVPAQSWLGSYERSQGTTALYCYAILFLVVVSELRTMAQLNRLQYAFVLTSPAFRSPPTRYFNTSAPILSTGMQFGGVLPGAWGIRSSWVPIW